MKHGRTDLLEVVAALLYQQRGHTRTTDRLTDASKGLRGEIEPPQRIAAAGVNPGRNHQVRRVEGRLTKRAD